MKIHYARGGGREGNDKKSTGYMSKSGDLWFGVKQPLYAMQHEGLMYVVQSYL